LFVLYARTQAFNILASMQMKHLSTEKNFNLEQHMHLADYKPIIQKSWSQ
jgi:hypothetical protein